MARFDTRCNCCREDKRWSRKSPRYRLALPPGTYSQVPAWTSRAWWLETVLPAAITHGRDVLRSHHIAPDTFARILAVHAMHADDDTGRGVTIDVEHLRLEAGCSERTVQRARACARELGIAVEVFRGRHLRLDERIEAYERHSRQRGYASVYALGCPAVLARHLPHRLNPVPAYPQVNDLLGERGTPPVGIPSGSFPSPRSHGSSATSADELAPLEASSNRGRPEPGAAGRSRARRPGNHSPAGTTAPATPTRQRPHRGPDRTRRERRRPQWNPEARRLAEALRREIPALRHTPTGRLVPPVTRFATSPTHWSPEQLVALIWHAARTRGWTTRPEKIRNPAAWLAHLLQGVNDTNPEDLPTDHPEHPDRQHDQVEAVISPDDPWAETLLPAGAPAASPAPPAAPRVAQATRPPGPRLTLWEGYERRERHADADAERATLRAEHDARRAERRREDLCGHGAPAADADGFSPRCALCRHQR